MNHRTPRKLLVVGIFPSVLLGLSAAAHASLPNTISACVVAQAAPPAPAASAPAADAQPDNRDAPARPAARRRGVGVVISMNLA